MGASGEEIGWGLGRPQGVLVRRRPMPEEPAKSSLSSTSKNYKTAVLLSRSVWSAVAACVAWPGLRLDTAVLSLCRCR